MIVRPLSPFQNHLVLLIVLDEEPIGGDVVSVHRDASVGEVFSPTDAVAMIGAPGPDVVQDHVIGVDLQAGPRLAGRGAANSEEHVLKSGGFGPVDGTFTGVRTV